MSKLDKEAISVFTICIVILAIIYTLVAIRFFTNDNIKEDTLSQNSDVNPEIETISKTEETTYNKQEQSNSKMDLPTEKEITQEKKEITNVSSRSKQVTKPTSTKAVSTPKTSTQQVTQTTVSKQTTTQPSIGTIKIPKTNVNMQILEKVSVSGMETNACFLYSTGNLNVDGNTVIVGHNYRNGKLFSNNNKLQIGDIIYITTLDGKTVTYTIYSKFVTTPEDVSFYKRDTNGKPEITLSCCSDDEQTRIILLAKP